MCFVKIFYENIARWVRGARCLSFTKRGKCWNNDEMNITKSMLVGMIEYLVDNIYVQQCVGISMGTDCAPLLAT